MPPVSTVTGYVRRVPLEAWAWTAGLLALAAADPSGPGLIPFCGWRWLGVLDLVGLERCPGCGLGHAVAFLLDGQFAAAIQTHPLAPFALAALAGRVATLLRDAYRARPARPVVP